MTTDPRISLSYMLTHPPATSNAIKEIIEKLRLRAIELGFLQVSDLVCLTTQQDILVSTYGNQPIRPEPAIYFSAALFDSDLAEFGLCSLPVEIEIGGVPIPFGVSDWTWSAGVRTRDLKPLSQLFAFAAENGLWTSVSFAGTTILCYRDAKGAVKYEQEWVEITDDF